MIRRLEFRRSSSRSASWLGRRCSALPRGTGCRGSRCCRRCRPRSSRLRNRPLRLSLRLPRLLLRSARTASSARHSDSTGADRRLPRVVRHGVRGRGQLRARAVPVPVRVLQVRQRVRVRAGQRGAHAGLGRRRGGCEAQVQLRGLLLLHRADLSKLRLHARHRCMTQQQHHRQHVSRSKRQHRELTQAAQGSSRGKVAPAWLLAIMVFISSTA